MSNDRYSRQAEIVSDKIHESHVIIIGVGAVGFDVAQTLTRNGVGKITLFDYDIVEEHNVPTQGWFMDQINKPKVECAAETLLRINPDIKVIAINDRWRPILEKKNARDNGEYDAIFSCVDSIDMRKRIFEYYLKQDRLPCLFDARIGGEQIRTFSVYDDDSKEHYKNFFYDDAKAFGAGCHIPMVKHSANIGASTLVQQYISHLRFGGEMMEKDLTLNVGMMEVFPTPNS